MRYYLLFFISSLFVVNSVIAQVIPDSIKKVKNYQEVNPSSQKAGFSLVDSYPMYPNGRNGINQLLIDNIRYPEKAKKNKIEGEVIIQFTINEDGYISNIKVVKSINKELDKEAMRVLKLMQRWEPAYQRGKPVKFIMTQSFIFIL